MTTSAGRRSPFLAWCFLVLVPPALVASADEVRFIRGDADGDGALAAADPEAIARYLFAGQPLPIPVDRADVNDNERITYADVLYLSDYLACPDVPALPEPETPGEDPDDDRKGFDEIDPEYGAEGSAELTPDGVLIRIAIRIPQGTVARGATLILEPEASLRPNDPLFCPASGLRSIDARWDRNRVVVTVGGAACGTLPRPNPARGAIELGIVRLAHGGALACDPPVVAFTPEHATAAGVALRATIIDAAYQDHHPSLATIGCADAAADFIRGDANGDGAIDVGDAIYNLSYLFRAGPTLCLDAQDVNDDGAVNIGDAIYELSYLFARGSVPAEPFRSCGSDPTPEAPCAELGCGLGCDEPAPAESPWPMFRRDLRHTGRTHFTGPAAPALAWTFTAAEGIVSSPSIGADGTIYFGSGWHFRDAKDNYLYALRPDGSLKWSHGPVKGFFSSPALEGDGMIYIAGLDGYLYAIRDTEASGELVWKTGLYETFALSSPAVSPSGTIYVGSPSFELYALAPDGSFRWDYPTRWCIISSPAIDDRGIVYIGSKDANLYAFDPATERPAWKFPTGRFYDGHLVDSSPAIGSDGTIYVGTDQYGAVGQTPVPSTTNFWAVRRDGTLKWSFETADGVESSPALGADGTVYFGSYDGHLYAVADNETEGTLRWKFKTGGAVDGSPVVDGDGDIYFGSRDGNVYALHPDGSVKWTYPVAGGTECSPTIDARGYLYIGSFDGILYALGTGEPDVGVSDLAVPDGAQPGTVYTPLATITNYRGAPQRFDVTCSIDAAGTALYSDTIPVYLAGGKSRRVSFLPWPIGSEPGASYTVTVTALHPEDENLNNNVRSGELRT